eukprot:1883697-Amphidinium_carterae.6
MKLVCQQSLFEHCTSCVPSRAFLKQPSEMPDSCAPPLLLRLRQLTSSHHVLPLEVGHCLRESRVRLHFSITRKLHSKCTTLYTNRLNAGPI